MIRLHDIALTALAPAIWGSTYLVTTELLPPGHPLGVAALRALPAGILLMVLVRSFPPRGLLCKVALLGALNFTVFWAMLFVTAYRLPGGVAATLGALQPIFVLVFARIALGNRIGLRHVMAALTGLAGVVLLVLSGSAQLDFVGVAAGLVGAGAMALGTVLSRKWAQGIAPITLTSWQLIAGGLLLVPLALMFEPPLPAPTLGHIAGYVYLATFGAATTYVLWFRGIARLEPATLSVLGFFSPVSAVLLGWVVLGQALTVAQFAGIGLVLGSIWWMQSEPQARRALRRQPLRAQL